MNGRRKPLVWTWPPARNGAPAPSIQAEITADPEIQPPAQEADPRPANGGAALQSPMEMAENTGDQPAEEQEKMAESSPCPDLAESPAETEMTVAVKSPAADAASQLPGLPDQEERVAPVHGPDAPPAAPGGMNYPDMVLARAYIPYQNYGPTYSPREALEKGTLFPALYRPYPY